MSQIRAGEDATGNAVASSQYSSITTAAPHEKRLFGAAAAVAALSILSSLLGLVRDLSLAGLFGASAQTDAFLVAWTVPETATPLVLEQGLILLLIPVFVAEIARSGSITHVVRLTLLPYLLLLLLLSGAMVVLAPLIVRLLGPGLNDPELAVLCFQVACLTVFFMGFAGYQVAALRSHDSFAIPATVYSAYNVGILVCMFLLHERLGVLSAALGLAVGSMLMVAVQLRGFFQLTSLRGLRFRVDRRILVAVMSFLPIATYTLGRQSQVFVERVVGSTLDAGAISYMNYATKLGQIPLLLVFAVSTVAFPALARAAATSQDISIPADRVLRQVVLLTLAPMAFLIIFAAPSVRFTFERGTFGAADTLATASILSLYSFGLLGQVVFGVGAFAHFAKRGNAWLPAAAAGVSLAVTVAVDVSLSPVIGVEALAVGNAAGISVAAIVVLASLKRSIGWRPGGLLRMTLLTAPLAFASAFLARLLCNMVDASTFFQILLGSAVTGILFFVLAVAVRVPEVREIVRTMTSSCASLLTTVRGNRGKRNR